MRVLTGFKDMKAKHMIFDTLKHITSAKSISVTNSVFLLPEILYALCFESAETKVNLFSPAEMADS